MTQMHHIWLCETSTSTTLTLTVLLGPWGNCCYQAFGSQLNCSMSGASTPHCHLGNFDDWWWLNITYPMKTSNWTRFLLWHVNILQKDRVFFIDLPSLWGLPGSSPAPCMTLRTCWESPPREGIAGDGNKTPRFFFGTWSSKSFFFSPNFCGRCSLVLRFLRCFLCLFSWLVQVFP